MLISLSLVTVQTYDNNYELPNFIEDIYEMVLCRIVSVIYNLL